MLSLRPATAADLPILNELYADMDGKPPLSADLMADLWQQVTQVPHYTIYLAGLNDEIVGTFSLLIAPTFMHRGFHKFALLDAVAVRSTHRSQGIGRQMMQQALQISQEAGCYKVMLSSNLMRDRAHAFYESLGFRQHGWSFSLTLPTCIDQASV